MTEEKGSIEFEVRYDLRNPPKWRRPWNELYAHFLDQVQRAEEKGFDVVQLNEHHFSEDGYLPSSVTMAAAIAARTSNIRIRLAVVILPLKHPVQLAEELAVVDILSNGRLEILVGAGYRREEYLPYGIAFDDRSKRMEEAIVILRRCWTESGFDFDGDYWTLRGVDTQPKPIQDPHPSLVMGGSTVGAARRAARLADGFGPTNFKLIEDYKREMDQLGKNWHPAMRYALRLPIGGATFTHLSQTPDESWQKIREPLHYVVSAYAGWAKNRPGAPHPSGETPEDLLTTGAYLVMTPEDAVAQGRQMLSAQQRVRLSLQPMMGGIPWDEGQRSLDLAADVVMPQLREFVSAR